MRRLIIGIAFFIVNSLAWAVTWQDLHCSDVDNTIIAMSTEEDGWILIGEVTLSNYYQSSETIKANLYVREIGKKLIYRVEYQGNYYATRWHDNSKSYHVTINDKTYRCDVPAVFNENDSGENNSAKYAGKWGHGNSWYVEIAYNNGRYNFKLNRSLSVYENIMDINEKSDEIIYTSIRKIDYSQELRKKGWRSYYKDRNNNADPGYPTSGRYEYDREVIYYTESISLQVSAPVLKGIIMHCYYYLQGQLTYADTSTDFSTHDCPITLTRF